MVVNKGVEPYLSQAVYDPALLKNINIFLKDNKQSSEYSDHSRDVEQIINAYNFILSPREKETLFMLTKGYKRRQIADFLQLSPKTVDTYTARLKKKCNLYSKNQLLNIMKNY